MKEIALALFLIPIGICYSTIWAIIADRAMYSTSRAMVYTVVIASLAWLLALFDVRATALVLSFVVGGFAQLIVAKMASIGQVAPARAKRVVRRIENGPYRSSEEVSVANLPATTRLWNSYLEELVSQLPTPTNVDDEQ